MDALRPDPWLLERPVVEALEAEVGLVVVALEEEAVPAGVVGALAERSGLPAGELPRQVPGSQFNFFQFSSAGRCHKANNLYLILKWRSSYD